MASREKEGPKQFDESHDHLMTELESSEGHIASTLSSIYENSQHEQFARLLESRIKVQDRDIERMCHHHYQGFIDSVRELLQVRTQADMVKNEIQATNAELQASGECLLTKADKLMTCRKTHFNICSVIEDLEMCLPVLEMYAKLQEQMKNKRYYLALKTLEHLEHTYLPRVARFRFTDQLQQSIPKIRERIREASMQDLKDFLESIRRHSGKVGEAAMKVAAVHHGIDIKLSRSNSRKQSSRHIGTKRGQTQPETNGPTDPDERAQSVQDLVDFSPVYRCLHINSILGARESFEAYYRKQRRQQVILCLDPPINMGTDLEGYLIYFNKIVGFFVTEDHIQNTTSGLVNRTYVEEVWNVALRKILTVLKTYTAYCTSETLSLQIKNTIVLFCYTMKGYGFVVTHLMEVLSEIRDLYIEILLKKWINKFEKVFDEDDYTAKLVSIEEEYFFVVKKFPYIDPKFEQAPFPKWFPFSEMVVRVFGQCKEYIQACLLFCEGLHLSHTEIDSQIRISTDMLLTRTLGGCLSRLLHQPGLTLLQLIQVAVNMTYLEKACDYLEDYISKITGAEKDSIHTSRLTGTSIFKNARSEAEALMYEKIDRKVDDFFDLANYDWGCQSPPDRPSGYILDLIGFLRSTFSAFTNLPYKLAQTACMSVCKHIAATLKSMLLAESSKSVTQGGLQQLNLDLRQCEDFAMSEPVPGMCDGTLLLAFSELRQLLDLAETGDWSSYVADYNTGQNRYNRVEPRTLLILLEKMKNGSANRTRLFGFGMKKSEKDKAQLLETVIKKVKGLL